MPLYICDCCGAVDNTACGGNFWIKNMEDEPDKIPDLCCKCFTGEWHNSFPYEICTKQVFDEIGEWNFAYWLVNNEKQPLPVPTSKAPKRTHKKNTKPRSKNHLKKLARGYKKRKNRKNKKSTK